MIKIDAPTKLKGMAEHNPNPNYWVEYYKPLNPLNLILNFFLTTF